MSDPIEEVIEQESKNDWFRNKNTGDVYCGDIKYQRNRDPIKRDEDGEPLEPEKYESIPIRPDKPHQKFNGTDWEDDPEAKQEAINSFVNQSMKIFMKAIYNNFGSLPAGMKTILADWKSNIDEFTNNL